MEEQLGGPSDLTSVITKEIFDLYEELKRSQTIDMSKTNQIEAILGISRATIMEIKKNYIDYKEKYDV